MLYLWEICMLYLYKCFLLSKLLAEFVYVNFGVFLMFDIFFIVVHVQDCKRCIDLTFVSIENRLFKKPVKY